MTGYLDKTLNQQIAILELERTHVNQLGGALPLWDAAVATLDDTKSKLHNYAVDLRVNAWFDQAGDDFGKQVHDGVVQLEKWHDTAKNEVEKLRLNIQDVEHRILVAHQNVCRIRDTYERDLAKDPNLSDGKAREEASLQLDQIDNLYNAITWSFIYLSQNEDWKGPRAAVPDAGGTPPGPGTDAPASGPAGSDSPDAATAGDPSTVDDPQSADVPDSAESPTAPQATSPLSDAASALAAAQQLLNGMQIPDAATVPDPAGVSMPEVTPFNEVPYDAPALAGLDTGGPGGGLGGGLSGGGTNLTGPGTGGPSSTGTAPVPAGMAGSTSGTTSGAGSTPMTPMSPQGAGAGTARQAGGGIKPGNSDRPAARERPRPRRGQATPGVALSGRAGATAPKPAARRGWDSDNDSLQVLDEQLWQVNPHEEETHGQDRRRPGRDGRDRAAAHPAADAGLVGPGGGAHQSARAR